MSSMAHTHTCVFVLCTPDFLGSLPMAKFVQAAQGVSYWTKFMSHLRSHELCFVACNNQQ